MGSFSVTYFHYFLLKHSLCRRVLVHFVGTDGQKAKEEHKFSSTDQRADKSGEQDSDTYSLRYTVANILSCGMNLYLMCNILTIEPYILWLRKGGWRLKEWGSCTLTWCLLKSNFCWSKSFQVERIDLGGSCINSDREYCLQFLQWCSKWKIFLQSWLNVYSVEHVMVKC